MQYYTARILSDAQIEAINNKSYCDDDDTFEMFRDLCDLGHTAKAERLLAADALERLRISEIKLARQKKDSKVAIDRLSRALALACKQITKLWKEPSGLSVIGWADLFLVKAAVANLKEQKETPKTKYTNEVKFTIFTL